MQNGTWFQKGTTQNSFTKINFNSQDQDTKTLVKLFPLDKFFYLVFKRTSQHCLERGINPLEPVPMGPKKNYMFFEAVNQLIKNPNVEKVRSQLPRFLVLNIFTQYNIWYLGLYISINVKLTLWWGTTPSKTRTDKRLGYNKSISPNK